MIYRKFYFFALLLFLPFIITAQEGPIKFEELITDRPDETEAPSVVPKAALQIETGFSFEERDNSNVNVKEWTWNTTLIRYGILENLELRLGTDVVQVREEVQGFGVEKLETGFRPLLVGAKVAIFEEKGILPEMGLMAHALLPFAASAQYRPQDTGFDFRFAFSHTINDNSGIAYNLGAEWHEDGSRPTYIYTIAYDYEISNRWGIFAELYGDLQSRESPEHFWDGGLTFLVAHNFQLDAFLGTGINNDQQLRAGAGLSYRIPY